METNEKLGTEKIVEEQVQIPDIDNLKIGEEMVQIKPAKVMIEKIELELVKFEKKKNENTKIKFMVQHPDVKEKLLEISKLTYLNGKTIKTTGIWLKLDSDGNIPFKSAIAELLRYTGKTKINDIQILI